MIYTTENDLNKLMDTIWMCVVNEEHPDFFVPNQGKLILGMVKEKKIP